MEEWKGLEVNQGQMWNSGSKMRMKYDWLWYLTMVWIFFKDKMGVGNPKDIKFGMKILG